MKDSYILLDGIRSPTRGLLCVMAFNLSVWCCYGSAGCHLGDFGCRYIPHKMCSLYIIKRHSTEMNWSSGSCGMPGRIQIKRPWPFDAILRFNLIFRPTLHFLVRLHQIQIERCRHTLHWLKGQSLYIVCPNRNVCMITFAFCDCLIAKFCQLKFFDSLE